MEHIGSNGVFKHAEGTAAFFHRAAFGVEGVRRQRPEVDVRCSPNIAIGGPSRPYARSIHGICMRTGNPFELRYGANRRFPHLPSTNLRFWSNACPLTETEVEQVAASIFRAGFVMRPSLLELTFDIADVTFGFARDHYVSPFRYEREFVDEQGGNTIYIGSPHSPVQVRIYDKRLGLLRLEIVFRSGYLRAHRMREIADVEAIRGVDLSRIIRLCRTHAHRALNSSLRNMPDDSRKKLLLNWPEHRPLQLWVKLLRYWRANPGRHLIDCELQRRVAAMQRRMVW